MIQGRPLDEMTRAYELWMTQHEEEVKFREEYMKAWEADNNPEGFVPESILKRCTCMGEKINGGFKEEVLIALHDLDEPIRKRLDELNAQVYMTTSLNDFKFEDSNEDREKRLLNMYSHYGLGVDWAKEGSDRAVVVCVDTEGINFSEMLSKFNEAGDNLGEAFKDFNERLKAELAGIRIHPALLDSLEELEETVGEFKCNNRASRRGHKLQDKSSRFTSEVCPRGAKNTIRRRSKRK